MIELLNSLSSDVSFYLPLVHQTYSELKLEDEKEDEFMFRAVLNARKNADELELNVTLLHHSICVFGHKLTTIFHLMKLCISILIISKLRLPIRYIIR